MGFSSPGITRLRIVRVHNIDWSCNTHTYPTKDGARISNCLTTHNTDSESSRKVVHPFENTDRDLTGKCCWIRQECLKRDYLCDSHYKYVIGCITCHNLALNVWIIMDWCEDVDILDDGGLLIDNTNNCIFANLPVESLFNIGRPASLKSSNSSACFTLQLHP